ncbi:Gfo/Idh/MocA family oxidoreductase [Rhizobium sp. RCAM05973]|uniref:Gfo/Idh/MocA family protein n=1 Tax=Rhizobium sp. RCAM05973 TaxID=2994066 RepID=UPI0022EBA7BC
METNGWSVMGTDTIASEHMVAAIRAIGHDPHWVISRSKDHAKYFSIDTGIPNSSTDVNKALKDPRVVFSYVNTILARRGYYIAAACAAGKHILCDGPISSSSKNARTLVAEVNRAGLVLAVNEPHRASTIHQAMRRLLLEGEIGKLQSLIVIRGSPSSHPQNEEAKRSATRETCFSIFRSTTSTWRAF